MSNPNEPIELPFEKNSLLRPSLAEDFVGEILLNVTAFYEPFLGRGERRFASRPVVVTLKVGMGAFDFLIDSQ